MEDHLRLLEIFLRNQTKLEPDIDFRIEREVKYNYLYI